MKKIFLLFIFISVSVSYLQAQKAKTITEEWKFSWWDRTFRKKASFEHLSSKLADIENMNSLNIEILKRQAGSIIEEMKKANRLEDAKNFQELFNKKYTQYLLDNKQQQSNLELNDKPIKKAQNIINSKKNINKKDLEKLSKEIDKIKVNDNYNEFILQGEAVIASLINNNLLLHKGLYFQHYNSNISTLTIEERNKLKVFCEDIFLGIDENTTMVMEKMKPSSTMDKPNLLKGMIIVDIRSIGFADPKNSPEHNCDLSRKRARGVMEHIEKIMTELLFEYSKEEKNVEISIQQINSCIDFNDSDCSQNIDEDCILKKLEEISKNGKPNQINILLFSSGLGELHVPGGINPNIKNETEYAKRRTTITRCNVIYVPQR